VGGCAIASSSFAASAESAEGASAAAAVSPARAGDASAAAAGEGERDDRRAERDVGGGHEHGDEGALERGDCGDDRRRRLGRRFAVAGASRETDGDAVGDGDVWW